MGLIKELSTRAISLDDFSQTVQEFFGLGDGTGVHVNKQNAMQIPAVYSAIRLLSETIASLPIDIFERVDKGKELREDHPLFMVLKHEPNPEMNRLEFVEFMEKSLLTWGNAYAQILRKRDGTIELWPINPSKVKPRRLNGRKVFEIRKGQGDEKGGKTVLSSADTFHLMGLSNNGFVGLSPIEATRRSLGLAKAAEKSASSFFENNSAPAGFLSHPGSLPDDEGKQELREQWESLYGGVGNSHRTAVLEEGMTWEPITFPARDAQHIQQREFQVKEIARIFRIQPHKLMQHMDSNFATVSADSINFVKFSLRPWLVRWEQAINQQIIPDDERPEIFAEFNVDALLRGDMEMRSDFYQSAFQIGAFSINDIRSKENMNPIDHPAGDKHFAPINMMPIEDLDSGKKAPDQSPGTENGDQTSKSDEEIIVADSWEKKCIMRARDREDTPTQQQVQKGIAKHRITRAMQSVYADAGGRVIRREIADVKEIINKHLPQQDLKAFSDAISEFYDDHVDFYQEQLRPVVDTHIDQIMQQLRFEVDDEMEGFDKDRAREIILRDRGELWTNTSRSKLIESAKNAEEGSAAKDVRQQLESFSDKREIVLSRELPNYTENDLSTAVYSGNASVDKKVWVSFLSECDGCSARDGVVVDVDEEFDIGDDFSGIEHPPLHSECYCSVVSK